MPVDLPTELWLRIAQFVPDAVLFRIATVNRLFLDLVTDRRYRHLIIDDDHPGALAQKLSGIEREPAVARRVRSLTVHPKAVRSACLKAGKAHNRMRAAGNEHWPDAFRPARACFEEDTELADRLLAALGRLPAVEHYAVEWPHGTAAERAFCLPLLATLWPLHAPRLLSLSLYMPLGPLCEILPGLGGLVRVQEVSLRLVCKGTDTAPVQGLGRLATFVNRVAGTLQNLALAARGHADFSPLFAALAPLPHLTRLALRIPCDPAHVADPGALNVFLRAHAPELSHLAFAPQHCCDQPSPGAAEAQWLAHALGNGLAFPRLRTLELALNTTGGGGPRVLPAVPRMAAAAAGAEALRVVGCVLALADLRALLLPFGLRECAGGGEEAAGPRRLALEVHVLDAALLEVLAGALPALHTLELTYRWVARSGASDVAQFAESLSGKIFTPWTALTRLVLRCSRADDASRWPCQQAIVRCLPKQNVAGQPQ